MRILEEYVKKGCFWLPEQPDNKILGTLTIKDGGDIELEAIGFFNESFENFYKNIKIDRIVGCIEDNEFVTLDNCFYVKRKTLILAVNEMQINQSIIKANKAFIGVAYDKHEQITFDSYMFSVDCLDEWFGVRGMSMQSNDEENTKTINYTPIPSLFFQLDNEIKLEIHFPCTSSINLTEAKFTQKAYFRLKSENLKPIDYFIDITKKLNNFICFAIDATVTLKSVRATSREKQYQIGEKTYPKIIKVFYTSTPYSEKIPNKNGFSMLFQYGVIENNAQSIFNNWINAYETISPMFNLYFATKENIHLEFKLLALVQGLETYHRRTNDKTLMSESDYSSLCNQLIENCPEEKVEWLKGRLKYGNEISLRQRLKQIIEPFEKYFGSKETIKRLIAEILDTRNFLTHYDKSLESKTSESIKLSSLCQKMGVIFQLHFLKIIGFSESEIQSIFEKSLKGYLD